MNLEDLKNPELQERLRTAQTPEAMLELVQEEGFELSDEQLVNVAGGKDWDEFTTHYIRCGKCGKEVNYYKSDGVPLYCPYCRASLG